MFISTTNGETTRLGSNPNILASQPRRLQPGCEPNADFALVAVNGRAVKVPDPRFQCARDDGRGVGLGDAKGTHPERRHRGQQWLLGGGQGGEGDGHGRCEGDEEAHFGGVEEELKANLSCLVLLSMVLGGRYRYTGGE
jgi:hypothetical protein